MGAGVTTNNVHNLAVPERQQVPDLVPSLRRWLMGTAAAFTLVAGLAPQQVSAETIRQALSSAYKYNPQLDSQRALLRATDEDVARANAGYRPRIVGTADVAYSNTNTRPDSLGEGTTHPKGYDVTLTQPVFQGGRVINGVREAESNVRAAREQLRNIEQQVLLAAATAYMDVVRDQQVVRLRENNVNVLTRELKATQDRFAVGEVTRTDVAQAQSRRAAAVSQLDLARANLKTSRATFERVVGHPPANLVSPSPPEKYLPKSVEEATAVAAREAPALVGALYSEQAARANVDKIWGELLPSVQVVGRYANDYNSSRTVDQTEATTVTAQLSVPIYEGGEVRARVRQAKHQHVSRLQQIEQFRSEAQATVVTAWSRLQASRAQLVSDQVAVQAGRTALQGVREEERVGQRTVLDVLNAEQELLNAEVQLASTQRDVVVNSYALISSIGRLNAQELGLTSAVYDPDAHYHEVRRKWFGISITHADGRRETMNAWPTHVERAPPPPAKTAKAAPKPSK
jgi:outer membrane protein